MKPKDKNKPPLTTPEGRSQFAKESAEAAAAAPEASKALALFTAGDAVPVFKNLKRRNLPQMVKPDEIPVGGAIVGEIMEIVDSPVATIKGKLLWMKHDSGREFLFPCTGVIRSALAPGIKDDDSKGLRTALEKEIGKMLVAKRMPDKESGKFKKRMFVFDVYTAEK